jgi:hypothetical protein
MSRIEKISIARMAGAAAVVGSLALGGGVALAATQGTLGSTSTGTSLLSATVPALAKITGVADLALGSFDGVTDLDGNDDVCVFSNVGAGTYAVTMSSANQSGTDFRIADGGATNFAVYNAYWNDVTTTTGRTLVGSGVQLVGQTGADNSSTSCGGGNTGNFSVNIPSANLGALPADSYTDTITILITPQ